MSKFGKLAVLIIGLLLVSSTPLCHAQDYIMKDIIIETYSDGFVDVLCVVDVDSSKAYVSIDLYGKNLTDVMVVNQNNRPLEYNISKTGIVVASLGSLSLNVTYSSNSFTSRIGEIWTLNYTAPITTTIILPKGASLLSTSIIPLDLRTLNGHVNVVFPAGAFSVNYLIGEVKVDPNPSQDVGDDRIFFLMAGIYVVIFALIVFVYWKLGKN